MILWSTLFSFAAPLAFAQPTEAVAEATVEQSAETTAVAATSALAITTDLHSEYLAGEPILVRFVVQNQSANPAQFSDLSRRPWLVRFKVKGEKTPTQTRYNLPPSVDEGQQWVLPVRARREVLLEIPSSSTFKSGDYSLEIRILEDSGERVLPVHAFRIRQAAPVGGQISSDSLSTARGGHQVLWTHQGQDGADLYLNHANAANPAEVIGNYHLLHLKKAVEPVLALSAPQQAWDRHVYWMQSSNSLRFARIRGHALRSAPASLNFPYPKVQLVGRGATDGQGALHVPVWISDPSGQGGTLRVATVDARGTPRFRKVLRADAVPELVVSGVDSTGGLRLLVGGAGGLALYSLPADSNLPAFGTRIVAKDVPVIAAHIGYLPESESLGGGLAIAVLERRQSDQGETLQVAWLGMDGRDWKRWPAGSIPAGAQVKDFLSQAEDFAVLVQKSDGTHVLIGPSGRTEVVGGTALGTLVPRLNGGMSMRRLIKGGPIKTTLLK
jgi:hypothetical protein